MQTTPLHSRHLSLDAKTAPFANWDMPIHYPDGILAEHRAVRTAAGLFDIAHMRLFSFSGPNAAPFLDALLSAGTGRLAPGRAAYSGLFAPDGSTIDDVFLYRVEEERFLLVANAANGDRVKEWIRNVAEGKAVEAAAPPDWRDLSEPGEEARAMLALQGPASLDALAQLADSQEDARTLREMERNAIAPAALAGVPVLAARTGYTGERVCFEIVAHPDDLGELWDAILEAGGPMGVRPAGLGARDSCRVEAGLPLFGHEIEGPLAISMHEAGYAFAVRTKGHEFIGREAVLKRKRESSRRLLRLRGQGRKTVRPSHSILDGEGNPVGQVTSFAYLHEDLTFCALALAEARFAPQPGDAVRGARMAPEAVVGEVDERRTVEMEALPRFPGEAERAGWPERYG